MSESYDKSTLGKPLYEDQYTDRVVGSLLGTTCGDILGANAEFRSAEQVEARYGVVHSFLDSPERPFGQYTDDTQMTLALTESLVECGCIDGQHCATTYAQFWKNPPLRGYGPAVTNILKALLHGANYKMTATMVYPEGSYANGGVMRIAPVGLAFRHASLDTLHQAVVSALLCTHVHPEAIDGAFLQVKICEKPQNDLKAYAVSQLSQMKPESFDAIALVKDLLSKAKTDIIRQKLTYILDKSADKEIQDIQIVLQLTEPNQFGKQFQIRSSEALACALWSLIRYGSDPELCLIKTVGLGGDADTVAAITGALLGSLHGTAWIPKRWFDNIENDHFYGRDGILKLAEKLAKLSLTVVDQDVWNLNHSVISKNVEELRKSPDVLVDFAKISNPCTKCVEMDVANEVWKILFAQHKYLSQWCYYMTFRKVPKITSGQWPQIIKFLDTYREDFSDFVVEQNFDKWAVIIGFVKWLRQKEEMK